MPNPFDRAMPMNIQGIGPLYGNGQALFDAFGDAVTRRFNLDQSQPSQGGGGMFGASPKVQNALTAFASGFLSRRSPDMSQQLMGGMQQQDALRTKRQQDTSDYNRKRADDRSDFQFEQDYKAAHQPPPDIQDRISVLNSIKPGLGDTYAQNYAANGGGMGPMLVNPLTGQQMIPAAKAPQQAPPDEAVARLKANPAEASQFDEIFGPGSSAKILGGQTGASLSGPFPDAGPYHRY